MNFFLHLISPCYQEVKSKYIVASFRRNTELPSGRISTELPRRNGPSPGQGWWVPVQVGSAGQHLVGSVPVAARLLRLLVNTVPSRPAFHGGSGCAVRVLPPCTRPASWCLLRSRKTGLKLAWHRQSLFSFKSRVREMSSLVVSGPSHLKLVA